MSVLASPDAWGVATGYWDVAGRWVEPPAETVAAVMRSMGAYGEPGVGGAASREQPAEAPMKVVPRGAVWPALPKGQLLLDGGGSLALQAGESPPPDVPFGYHRFQPDEPGETCGVFTIAVCPPRCPAPPEGRTWGWSAQLYAARSRDSWGMGDMADLRRLAAWAGRTGAGFVLLNPLHAPAPGAHPEPSPYFPSSRCFLNPLYLRIEEVPGAEELPFINELAAQGAALDAERLIDRTAVWALKSKALEELFRRFQEAGGDQRFDAYVSAKGALLDSYTTFCALAEVHGLPWQSWPEGLRRPGGPAVGSFAASTDGARRKRYHAWLQWLSDTQLAQVGEGPCGLLVDMAVGVDAGGADAWLWQDVFALDMRVGAPPDDFNTAGQDWGLPPWDPWKLRAASYEPYIATLRAALGHAHGLRLDHVMGLFRLFWVPVGSEPRSGTYVRYPWQDMLGLLCLEAHRAGAYVVGEDLGTVEDEAREALAGRGVLSYKLLWFEPEPPPAWPRQALAAVTTHDLPTIAGAWSGSDLQAQRDRGLEPNEDALARLRARLIEWTGSEPGEPAQEVIEKTYALLGQAPCALITAPLEDALCVAERPNVPGTAGQWPNWSLALPSPLEELERSSLAGAIARRLCGR
ncbi:MAG: 4-alpha-glucanotransferase [Acidimicrobiales bacterium]